ncbi:D-isomer specific 2-hydroxyacid dehydrogenase family protein [Nonomuraea sp. NPDC050783]|uniref:D-isomer specific 2-hydroxyacid dehydrogenase family protein n=1 Tax=Nonomuraea sp. NPDC050783 TaxID=3154634 RepID=UPI00346765F8
MTVAVHVGPEPVPVLVEAVRRAGGQPVPLEEAEAIVYYGSGDPDELRGMVHDRIRWVQLPNAGVERLAAAGVITDEPVFTAATGSYGPQVAEHTLALMLAAARRLYRDARATSWGPNDSAVFAGSTVAIVGHGGIGRALVRLLEPFGCPVIAVTDRGEAPGAARVLPRDRFREALPEAAYVVVAAPLTPRTRGMFGAREFALMREDAWLVNVARGALVVTDDLVAALRERRIGGAALDVTDPEPLPDGHALWELDNVLITPHSANPRPAYWRGLVERVTSNVRRFAEGAPLEGRVSPSEGF